MSDRIYSIDSLRAVAIFFVVIAHTEPFHNIGTYGNQIYFLLDTIGQFDIPFFFITSGYFLAYKLKGENIKSYIKGSTQKLWSYYVFGSVLYFPILMVGTASIALINGRDVINVLGAQLDEMLSLTGLLYYGDSIAVHLWFLPALMFSICLVSLFAALGKEKYLLPVSLSTYNWNCIPDYPKSYS